MLRTLSVRSFAIIERLDLEFGPGFNVLTGETGAGKSILMDALNLLLGSRAGAEMVRAGAAKAMVDAVFDVSDAPDVLRAAEELGFEAEDGQLFLSREVSASGKSTGRIGGRPAAIGQLREIGEYLVDLHGQHEHQALLAVPRHIDMLDSWGGREFQSLRAQIAEAFHQAQRLKRERESLQKDARERARLLDLYQFQVAEIADAALREGEDEELDLEYRRISNAQRLAESAAAAAAVIGGGDEGGVVDALSRAVRGLEDAAELDETLSPIVDAVRAVTFELAEAERDLARYQDEIEFDPERQQEIEARLELIRALKRKYGDTIEEVLAYGRETAEQLDALSNSEERGAALDREIAAADKRLHALCERLSSLRCKAAREFEQVTQSELRDLGMAKTRFEVQLAQAEPTPKGTDRVEFLIAVNPGEPLRPLAKVASGGEVSRVTLAIKSAMAHQEALPTMVFDEIDIGIGGRTAGVIAEKMAHLARSTQVICITHLAQIASRGSSHFSIEKEVSGERTTVRVVPLDAEGRVGEVARMIGGANVTDAVLQHAREMLSAPTGK
jgi:DNA repair protein RecN (Recombination protein N)